MESRARYLFVGLFTLAAIVAGFLFVLWIHTSGGLSQRRSLMIQFNGAASGLRPGSAVLFNGVRVGEVTAVSFDAADPVKVTAFVSVDKNAPLRTDTRVGIESQGLLGTTAIALSGAGSDAPLLPLSSVPSPMLQANATGGSVTEEARQVLEQIKGVLSDNAEPLKETIKNIDVFSAALARNSSRLDNIVAGLEQMTGHAPKPPPPQVYDLNAPTDFPPGEKQGPGQVVVADVGATVMFETQKLLIKTTPEGPFVLGDAQWADSLPKLVQKKVIETFENAHYLNSVVRPTEQGTPEYQLILDIRSFEIDEADHRAVVELAARLIGQDGHVIDAQILRGVASTSALDGTEAVEALTKAFGAAARDLVDWFGRIAPK